MQLHGFIMLHRKILDWEWFSDANVRDVFILLLLLASFRPTRWRGMEVAPGQVVTSYAHLAEKLGLGIKQVRNAFEKLQATGEISVKTTNKFSLVTIEKWAFYQSGEEKGASNGQTTDTQRARNGQHRNNVNNINNVKKLQSLHVFDGSKYDDEKIRKAAREKIRKKIGMITDDDTPAA